jgi:hypothetical protein
MSIEVKKLLPPGSVVSFPESDKKFMIMGIMQQVPDGDGVKKYDYIGVPYPEGYVGKDSVILFNHSSIKEFISQGFVDLERQSFMATVRIKLGETWGD